MVRIRMVGGQRKIIAAFDVKTHLLVEGSGARVFRPDIEPHTLLIVLFGQFDVELQEFVAQFFVVERLEQIYSVQLGDLLLRDICLRDVEVDFGIACSFAPVIQDVVYIQGIKEFGMDDFVSIFFGDIRFNGLFGGAVSVCFYESEGAQLSDELVICRSGSDNGSHDPDVQLSFCINSLSWTNVLLFLQVYTIRHLEKVHYKDMLKPSPNKKKVSTTRHPLLTS
jgi:hypothetical protein